MRFGRVEGGAARRTGMTGLQREEPVDATWRTPGQRHQADIQPRSRCRREDQQCVEQLTTALLPRDRGPRTTGPLWPGGLESTQSWLPILALGASIAAVRQTPAASGSWPHHSQKENTPRRQPHVAYLANQSGSCWVAQWMPPPPAAMPSMLSGTTSRPAKSSASVLRAASSARWSPNSGTSSPPLQT